ncbi:hypothetical protein ASG49_05675 [Marmoricola sp. Leaf446]|uniref:hypothetical protein n=1 Tax=Marmoricola sp. Leaf446 TaxID=1736379 RepID=UPI0007002C3A|nr:hypothetical protein [Marmoricola sp. Leaf446]KQT94369.1 hypothetical protein ASG49_05675 [Marmoricola sp. Leaf446]
MSDVDTEAQDTDTTGADDPGWALHEVQVDGEYVERWLYHYADAVVVDEDGVVHEPDDDGVMAPVDLLEDDQDERGDQDRDDVGAAEDGPAEAHDADHEAPSDDTPDPDPDPDPDDPDPDLDPATEEPEEPEEPAERSAADALFADRPDDETEDRSDRDDLDEGEPDPDDDRADERSALARLPARAVLLTLLALSALLTIALLGVVVVRWDEPAATTETATPASRLQLPVAVAPDSEYVRSRVRAEGDIRVDHWIASTRPVSRLRLSVPTVPGTGSDPVTAREVRVETPSGDRPGPGVVRGSSAAYSLDGAEEVHVSYVLTGAVMRSDDDPDRALARLTSLDLDVSRGRVPRTVTVLGGRLLSAACAADAAATPRPCGQAEGRTWRVRLEPAERDDLVQAQLDLS